MSSKPSGAFRFGFRAARSEFPNALQPGQHSSSHYCYLTDRVLTSFYVSEGRRLREKPFSAVQVSGALGEHLTQVNARAEWRSMTARGVNRLTAIQTDVIVRGEQVPSFVVVPKVLHLWWRKRAFPGFRLSGCQLRGDRVQRATAGPGNSLTSLSGPRN
jgi:hypothetical protein